MGAAVLDWCLKKDSENTCSLLLISLNNVIDLHYVYYI